MDVSACPPGPGGALLTQGLGVGLGVFVTGVGGLSCRVGPGRICPPLWVPLHPREGCYVTSKNGETQNYPIALLGVHPKHEKQVFEESLASPCVEKPGPQQMRGRSGPGVRARTLGETGLAHSGILVPPPAGRRRAPPTGGPEHPALTKPDTGGQVPDACLSGGPCSRPLHRDRGRLGGTRAARGRERLVTGDRVPVREHRKFCRVTRQRECMKCP